MKWFRLVLVLLCVMLMVGTSELMAGRSTQDFYYSVDDPDVTSIRVFMYPVSGGLNVATHPYVPDGDLDGHVVMENIPNGTHFFLIVLYDGTLPGSLCYEQELTKTFEVVPGCATSFSFTPPQ